MTPFMHYCIAKFRYYSIIEYQGCGLGLFIAAEILKRHDGIFWIESEQGKGSTFFFELPYQKQ